jgi:hypothetical protein
MIDARCAFETSRRHEVLSFNHHREVAALPPAEADALLNWCEEPVKTTGKPHLKCPGAGTISHFATVPKSRSGL